MLNHYQQKLEEINKQVNKVENEKLNSEILATILDMIGIIENITSTDNYKYFITSLINGFICFQKCLNNKEIVPWFLPLLKMYNLLTTNKNTQVEFPNHGKIK